jgi:DNA-directed RNA polymerase specialized sigma24 family protein
MIGGGFTDVLRAAQQGSAVDFARLWRDANPAMTRYLSVVSSADPHDVACESWVIVVRGLPAFEGDEGQWRSRLFAAARAHADEEAQREEWALMPGLGIHPALAGEPRPVTQAGGPGDDVGVEPATGSRLDAALAALRGLPREEAEVFLLRHVGRLSDDAIAASLGTAPATTSRLMGQAEQRLGASLTEVVTALTLPARAVELADESAVLTVYGAMTSRPAAGTAVQGQSIEVDEGTVVSLAPENVSRAPLPVPAPRRQGAARTAPSGGSPATRVVALRRTALGAGASVAASAVVLGLGGLSAAAYTGVLPDPVQDVMHRVIGAPPAHDRPDAPASSPSGTAPHVAPAPPSSARAATTGVDLRRPGTLPAAPQGLCTAWAAQLRDGRAPQQSPAFDGLVEAAGGEAKVAAYCATVLPPASATSTERVSSTAQPSAPVATAPPVTSTPPVSPTETSTLPETTTPPPSETTTTPPPETTIPPSGPSDQESQPPAAGRPTERPRSTPTRSRNVEEGKSVASGSFGRAQGSDDSPGLEKDTATARPARG